MHVIKTVIHDRGGQAPMPTAGNTAAQVTLADEKVRSAAAAPPVPPPPPAPAAQDDSGAASGPKSKK